MKTKIIVFIFLSIFGNMSYAQCWTKGYNGWNLTKVAPFTAMGSLDGTRSAVQIHTVQQPTNAWAAATAIFDGVPATTDVIFTSLQETDGECSYRVLVNGTVVLAFQNPRIYRVVPAIPNYTPYTVGVKDVVIPRDARIQVEFLSNSNGLVPEGAAFGYARARWRSLSIGSNCTSVTVDRWVSVTSVNSTSENKVVVYPNPCTNFVAISNVSEKADIKLFNLLGKELAIAKAMADGEHTLNTSTLTTGIYFVSVNGLLTKLMKK